MSVELTGNYRLTVRVPFSVLEVVDRIIQNRVGDGESSVNRSSVIIELLKIGARIEKKKLDNVESGGNPFDSRLEEQLSFIGQKVSETNLKVEKLFHTYLKNENVSEELYSKIRENVVLSDKEEMLLKRLFSALN